MLVAILSRLARCRKAWASLPKPAKRPLDRPGNSKLVKGKMLGRAQLVKALHRERAGSMHMGRPVPTRKATRGTWSAKTFNVT